MRRPALLLLTLLLAAAPAHAQLLDGRREQHRETPDYGGIRANAPIHPDLHRQNEGGSDRQGLCVIASVETNGKHQGVPGVDRLFPIAKTRPGGYSPDKLQRLLDEVLPDEKWASYVGTNTAVLDDLSARGLPIGATMNTGELYRWQPIHHMVSLVHFNSNQDRACVVDNNKPRVFSWMTAREFARRWIDGGTDWAFVWTRRPPVSLKSAGITLWLAAAACLLLAATRARAGDPEPEGVG